MQEQFITYEQALQFKKLGFNEECLGYYYYKRLDLFDISNFLDKSLVCTNTSFASNYYTTAPLRQQAFDWFRKEHDLQYKIEPTIKDKQELFIHNIGWKYIGSYNSYEEARLACLVKLIELVKR
jgi:hypothetical protein